MWRRNSGPVSPILRTKSSGQVRLRYIGWKSNKSRRRQGIYWMYVVNLLITFVIVYKLVASAGQQKSVGESGTNYWASNPILSWWLGWKNSDEWRVDYPFPVPTTPGSITPTVKDCCWAGNSLPAIAQPSQDQEFGPNMFIMGAQKGGTTYMSLLLNQHKDFLLPMCPKNGRQTKEMHFWEQLGLTKELVDEYSRSWGDVGEAAAQKLGSKGQAANASSEAICDSEEECDQKGKARSLSLTSSSPGLRLASPTKIRYEGTPSYIRSSFVPCRVRHFFPHAKIVLMLRDPVDRAVSQYKMNYGTYPKAPPLMSARVEKELAELREAGCTWQGKDAGLGKSYSECFGCAYDDPGRFCWSGIKSPPSVGLTAELVGKGLYAPQLAWLLNFFPPSQILLVNYEDVKANVFGVADRIAHFMGSNAQFEESMLHMPTGDLKPAFRLGEEYERSMPDDVKKDMEEAKRLLEDFYRPLNQYLYRLTADYGLDFKPFGNTYDRTA